MRKKNLTFGVVWGFLFFSFIFLLSPGGWTLEKNLRLEEKTSSRFSFLIGTFFPEKGRIAYRGGISYFIKNSALEFDGCIFSGQERIYSTRLTLEGSVEEPEVNGRIFIFLNWEWKRIEEEERRENSIYSLFLGERLNFRHGTYLYIEVGGICPGKEETFFLGWSGKAGWKIFSWMEVSAGYGQFLARGRKVRGYDQWTLKEELKFTLGKSYLFVGYEKSSLDDPFYLVNMHLPESFYTYLSIPF